MKHDQFVLRRSQRMTAFEKLISTDSAEKISLSFLSSSKEPFTFSFLLDLLLLSKLKIIFVEKIKIKNDSSICKGMKITKRYRNSILRKLGKQRIVNSHNIFQFFYLPIVCKVRRKIIYKYFFFCLSLWILRAMIIRE